MTPLDPTALASTSENYLIDFQAPGAPLIISFGFFNATGPAAFNFWGRLKKLESVSGRPLNKLLLRDPSQLWYLGGIAGLGSGVPSTVSALRTLIDRINPSCVITLGQSMGAYAAVLYATLLGADKAIPFGPLSCFDRRMWELISDTRWLSQLEKLEKTGIPFAPYGDLPALIQSSTLKLPDIDLIYGSNPGPTAVRSDAVGYDAAHALRFAQCPNVTFLPVAFSLHAVVEYFRALGAITQVLAQRIFGTSLLPTIAQIRDDSPAWAAWLDENIARGSPIADLRPMMLPQMTPEQADSLIERTKLITTLQRFETTPPVFTA